MATSKYFNHINSVPEQSLIDDLTKETIFQRGIDMYYIPREESIENFDYLFGEDPTNSFGAYVMIEMWCENVSDGFAGEASIVTRFGLEINDEATFQVSRTRFTQEITKVYPEIIRPREGDLLAFPMAKSVFEIKFVEHEKPFYTMGKSNVFELETQKFRWSHEDMVTGLEEVDDIVNVPKTEDNTDLQTESTTFLDHNEDDPFSEGNY